MGTLGTTAGSLSYLAPYFGVRCVLYLPSRKRALRSRLLVGPNTELVEYGRSYEDCVVESRRAAERHGWYDANPGLANNLLNMYSFEYIAEEIRQQLERPPTHVICQTSNGSSVSGLHLGFKRQWVAEVIDRLPRIHAASTSHGNAIVEAYRLGSKRIVTLDRRLIRESRYNRNVVNAECYNGQDALNAVYDTEGAAVGVSDDELLEAYEWLRRTERFRLTVANAYPVAALLGAARRGALAGGRVVVVLNDGRVDVEVRRLRRSDLGMSYEQFLATLNDWLVRFTDPLAEIRDATDDAFTNGFVLGAFQGSELVGAVVVSTGRYETFFPKYHLSYIATKKTIKGMGIATQLIAKVIELTEGDFSLHVETDNRGAIKLYEKMGLRKKYYRMFYAGARTTVPPPPPSADAPPVRAPATEAPPDDEGEG